MLERLKAFATDKRHIKYDSCIAVIMGHGDDGTICDIDGEGINIDREILNLFNGSNAPGFVGKPKFFIFQACRGGNSDDGAVLDHQQKVSRWQSIKYQYESFSNKISKWLFKKSPAHGSQRGPSYSDFFVFYATVPTMVSYRYTIGSEFIINIKKVFDNFAHIKDLEDMAKIIKGRVGNHQFNVKNEIKFQQPQLATTNSKKYFKFPGIYIESDNRLGLV